MLTGMFERCLYFNLNALTRAVNRIWDQAFAEFDLSPAHAYLLRLVLASPGLTPKQLAQELKLEKSTVTRFLHALEDKDMLVRKSAPSKDGRELGIYPTARARKIGDALQARGEKLYQTMRQTLGEEALTSLVGTLKRSEKLLT